jgi:hypothetical protein
MQLAPRSIAALAVVGALSLFTAGCSAGDDPTPSSSPSRTVSPSPSASGPSSAPSSSSSAPTSAEPSDDDVPTAFPGSGQTPEPDTDPSDFPATALVTFSGWDAGTKTLQAGGLVSGTTDTSGKCTFRASKGGVARTQTSTAEASASSVNCAQVSFPASQLSAGTWSITLEYSVGSASTTSDPMTAEVP